VAAALVVKGVATYSGISEAVVSLRAHAPDVRLIRRRVTSIADMQMQLTQRLRRDTSSLQKWTTALAVGARDTFRLRKAISRVKARIRKLDTDLGRIREVADKATMELGQREHIINHLCATARNAFCRTQWRMGFAQGMRELMAASVMSSGSTGQDATAEPPVLPSPSAPWRRRRCPPSASTCGTICSCRESPPRRRGRLGSSCCSRRGAAVAVCILAPTEVPSLGQHERHNMLVSRAAAEATRSDGTELLLASETQYLTLEDCARPGQQASVCYVSWPLGQGTLKV